MPAPKPSPAPAPALSEAIIVNTSDSGGGAERIATTLLDGFEQRGVRTRLVVGDRRRDDARVVALHESSVFDYRPSARLDRRLRSRTRRRLDRRRGYEDFEHPYSHHLLELLGSRPDVVVCENLHGGYFDLRALRELARQVPVVLRLDDSWLLTGHCAVTHGCERWETGCGSCPDLARPPAVQRDATAENWRRKRSMLSGLELAAVAPSRWMLERAQRSLLAGAIADWREIPDGIDLETFRPGDPGPGRATLGVGPGCVVALFVAAQGARNPHKDFTTLRAAFAGAAQDATAERPLELVVVGATAPTEQLTPHARIRHLAFEHSPAKLAELYRAADVYVHAAMEETRSLVASEALACGTPVAAAAAGGIREVVRDGRTGYVVAPGDTAGLALAVGRLAADSGLRAGLGSAAAEDARERFDVKGMVDAMHAFCEELVVRRPGAFKPTGEIGTIPT
jgi:glycosyltransferase involved in cell wall biosynthesis